VAKPAASRTERPPSRPLHCVFGVLAVRVVALSQINVAVGGLAQHTVPGALDRSNGARADEILSAGSSHAAGPMNCRVLLACGVRTSGARCGRNRRRPRRSSELKSAAIGALERLRGKSDATRLSPVGRLRFTKFGVKGRPERVVPVLSLFESPRLTGCGCVRLTERPKPPPLWSRFERSACFLSGIVRCRHRPSRGDVVLGSRCPAHAGVRLVREGLWPKISFSA